MSFEDKKDLPAYGNDKAVATLEAGSVDEIPAGEVNAFGQKQGEQLTHQLKPRHLAMISIGGVIGTGLFVGTGGALAHAGPVGLWLGYMLMGSVCYSMMMCLGEMISYLPVPGGPIKLAERFVGKPLSFALGFNYAYNWLIVLPAELSAAALLVEYWTDVNAGVFIAIFLVVVVAINLLGTRAYGEAEFWFASIKVITIVGLIILSICIDLGAGKEGRIGFRYWKNPGPFVQYNEIAGSWGRFLGFFSVLIQSAFSYIGTEIVAIAAGEARNPRKSVTSAIKKVWIRIVFFYVVGTFCIGLVCPSNAPTLTVGAKVNRSPFVVAIRVAGIKGLPSVINAALITSAVSAASSDIYTSSRAIYSLSIAGQLPRIFARTTRRGLPYVSVLFSVLFSFLSFLDLGSGSSVVFNWFASMTAVCGLSSWFCIGVMHVQFTRGLKAQGLEKKSLLPFVATGSTFMSWWVIFWTSIVILFSGFDVFLAANAPFNVSTFVTTYIPIPVFLIMFFGSWIYYGKDSIISVKNIDFFTGIKEIEADTYEEPAPKNLWEKTWKVIC